jgi:hypothetical protein
MHRIPRPLSSADYVSPQLMSSFDIDGPRPREITLPIAGMNLDEKRARMIERFDNNRLVADSFTYKMAIESCSDSCVFR